MSTSNCLVHAWTLEIVEVKAFFSLLEVSETNERIGENDGSDTRSRLNSEYQKNIQKWNYCYNSYSKFTITASEFKVFLFLFLDNLITCYS